MRINTSGSQEYRSDLFERTADALDESTKTGGVEHACVHTNRDIENKREAMNYLAGRLSARELQEVAEILSTDQVSVAVEIEQHVGPK